MLFIIISLFFWSESIHSLFLYFFPPSIFQQFVPNPFHQNTTVGTSEGRCSLWSAGSEAWWSPLPCRWGTLVRHLCRPPGGNDLHRRSKVWYPVWVWIWGGGEGFKGRLSSFVYFKFLFISPTQAYIYVLTQEWHRDFCAIAMNQDRIFSQQIKQLDDKKVNKRVRGGDDNGPLVAPFLKLARWRGLIKLLNFGIKFP